MHEWLGPAVREAMPLATQEARSMLAPALGKDFKRFVAPTLTLAGSAGMSEQDITAWLAAAAEMLSGIPADLLEIGCRAAREKADHPAKIIPAIMEAVRRPWAARRADMSRLDLLDRIARGERQPMPWEGRPFDDSTRCTADQAAAIAAEFGFGSAERVTAPKAMPSVEDYMRETGISREQAEKLVTRQKAQMLGKQVGEARAA